MSTTAVKQRIYIMSDEFNLKQVRNNLVAKDNRLIQQGRNGLDLIENKAILYLISKIQPDDEPGKHYHFNCQEFKALLNWSSEASYDYIKIMLQNIADVSQWIEDERDGKKKDILLRWFNIVRMDPGDGDIEISFHEDMFPYVVQLIKSRQDGKGFFTTYRLQNVSLMKHKYSIKIYELLKSFSNNNIWVFENGTGSEYDLQRKIADTEIDKKTRKPISKIPENWSNFAIFKRDVLEPAKKEINKYTDIEIDYAAKKQDINHRKTRAIRTIEFYMVKKTKLEQQKTDETIDKEYDRIEDENNYHQMSLDELESASIKEAFFKRHAEALEKEKMEESEKAVNESKFPILYEALNVERRAAFSEEKIEQLYNEAIKDRVPGNVSIDMWELFAVDYITYYYNKIKATPENTKTDTYNRLLDSVKNDYDKEAFRIIKKY